MDDSRGYMYIEYTHAYTLYTHMLSRYICVTERSTVLEMVVVFPVEVSPGLLWLLDLLNAPGGFT